MTEINKSTRTEKIENFLFSMQLICVVISAYCGIWQIPGGTRALIIVSCLINLLLVLITLSNKNNKYTVVIWLLIIFLSFFSVSRGRPDFTFQYIKNWIIFISTINILFWAYATKVTEEMVKKIFLCGLTVSGLFIVAFLSGRANANLALPNYVTFGLSNPNRTGIYLLNIFLTIFIMFNYVKRIFYKIILFILSGVLFYFVCLTESRSCIIAAAFCILISIFANKSYKKFLTSAILIFPLIFVIMYLKLIDTNIVNLFSFMEHVGKPLTSRVKIWEYTLDIIENNMFLGNYYLGLGNKHNTHLTILAAFGFPTLIFVIAFFNRIVNYIGQFLKNRYQFTALYAFYAIIIMGTFEAVLFTGGHEMYVFTGAFLMLAKYQNNKSIE